MAARTLAFNLAAAEEIGRQSVSQMRSPLPNGIYRLPEPSHSLLHRLEYVELPVQTNFSKPINVFLAWGMRPNFAKCLIVDAGSFG